MDGQPRQGSAGSGVTKKKRFVVDAAAYLVNKRLFRKPNRPLADWADRSWEVAPAQTIVTKRAFFLPDQLERVTGMAFTDNLRGEMEGGWEWPQRACMAHQVNRAVFLDGAVYKGNASHWIHDRTRGRPFFWTDSEFRRGSLYSTFDGNGYFGQWLNEDCPAYLLAAAEGQPVTSAYRPYSHMSAYENLMGMQPSISQGAFFHELVFFDDGGRTDDKGRRYRAMGEKIRSHFPSESHPGVFLLRRDSGKKRILLNEEDLAQSLRTRRGFRVVDVTQSDVATIQQACAGAKVIIGVEGSNLVHGLISLQPGGAIVALQPPFRFAGVIKWYTDLNDQHYGFVVGREETGGYRIDLDEVERTLDLLPN